MCEFKLTQAGGAAAPPSTRTWTDAFPVSRVVKLPPGTLTQTPVITSGGAPAGTKTDVNPGSGDETGALDHCVVIDAEYVTRRVHGGFSFDYDLYNGVLETNVAEPLGADSERTSQRAAQGHFAHGFVIGGVNDVKGWRGVHTELSPEQRPLESGLDLHTPAGALGFMARVHDFEHMQAVFRRDEAGFAG
jgi:hypothetical protein